MRLERPPCESAGGRWAPACILVPCALPEPSCPPSGRLVPSPLEPEGATWPPALPVSLCSRNAPKKLLPSEEATCDMFRQWPASASSLAGQRLCVTPHPSPGAARGTAERPAKKSGGVRDATSVTRRQDLPINEVYFVGNSFAGFN